MAMKIINEETGKIRFVTDVNISLANAIRRSVNEIPILAVSETDIYKNDSALYDEVIAHRIGLIPLKNQKLKAGQSVEMKFKVKGKKEGTEVLSGELGSEVIHDDMPIVLLEEGQEIELVARATVGKGKDHARFVPGLVFYGQLPKITISKEGEKQTELAKLYPKVFSLEGDKLKVKDAAECELDEEDMKKFPGVDILFGDELLFSIESWGQIEAKDIFIEAAKALKANLSEVSKVLK
jgi:DNA-directed RNA polymerase subunit D